MEKKKVYILVGVGLGLIAVTALGIVVYKNQQSLTDSTSSTLDKSQGEYSTSGNTEPDSISGAGSTLSSPTKEDNINTWKENKPILKELCGRRILINGKRKDAWLACIARGGVES